MSAEGSVDVRHTEVHHHDRITDHMWVVSTYLEALGDAALADLSLSLPSSGLLETVLNAPGVTVAEVARTIPKTQQAISQVAARLEKLGYLERRLGSGRGVGLHLTEAGARVAREAIGREQALDRRLRERLGARRFDELTRLLTETREILEPEED